MEAVESTVVEQIKQQVYGTKAAAPVSNSVADSSTANPDPNASASGATNSEIQNKPVENAAGSESNIQQPSPPPAFDPTSFLKENFNVEKVDDIKAQLLRIQELEQKANTPAEFQFSSEQAKLIANAINSGDYKPLKEYVDTQLMLSNTEGMTEEQQLKLFIKMKNPLFSDKLVDEEYREQYELNEEDVDESRVERERLKLAQKRIDDAKQAQSLFAERKSKISLPTIPVQTANDDPAYVAWKEAQDKILASQQENAAAYGQLTAKDLANTFQFNDEANNLKFDVSFEPDAQSFSEIMSNIMDDEKFPAMFANQDGSLDRKKFAKVIYDGMNVNKIVNQSIVDAVNKTKLWFLANQKNIGDISVRNFNVAEQTDVDRLRQQVYGK